jgi:hypothetical protein
MWCPICATKKSGIQRRLTIGTMCDIALKRGGRCLSKDYINIAVKLLWQCQYGHQWSATPANVKRGTWCPVCFGRKPVHRE